MKKIFIAGIIIITALLAGCASVSNTIVSEQYTTEHYIFTITDRIRLSDKSNPQKTVWESTHNFLEAYTSETDIKDSRGMFFIKEHIKSRSRKTTILETRKSGNEVFITGTISGPKEYPFTIEFLENNEGSLDFLISVPNTERIILHYAAEKNESVTGFGEQFTYFNLKGKKVPIAISEQGIGRGEQPITFGANLSAKAGGNYSTTYIAVPFFITSGNQGMYFKNYEYMEFDLSHKDESSLKVFSNQLAGTILDCSSPKEMITAYSRYSGKMQSLPDWVNNGIILGVQGGTDVVMAKLQKMLDAGVKISAVWIQDWVGQRTTSFGKQLWWNWTLDTAHYHDWDTFRNYCDTNGIKILGYISPFLVDKEFPGRRSLFKEAESRHYLVKNRDGHPYMVQNTDFYAGLVDFTNPDACKWFIDVIHTELLDKGFSGWMADFGEAAPYNADYYDSSIAQHNRYPELWAEINRQAVKDSPDTLYFMRAGFTRSPGKTSLFWLGDQLVNWGETDGIASSVTGLLTGGISGFALNHSDTGGYTTITSPLKNYHRSRELLIRWLELNSVTAVLRSHEGNQPDNNAQLYSDPELIALTGKFSRLYTALTDYRTACIKETETDGLPYVRHMIVEYPDLKKSWDTVNEQFMVGPDIIAAPVLKKDAETKSLFLPEGDWISLWDNQVYHSSNAEGTDLTVNAPLDTIQLFIKAESPYLKTIQQAMRDAELISY